MTPKARRVYYKPSVDEKVISKVLCPRHADTFCNDHKNHWVSEETYNVSECEICQIIRGK